MIDRHSLQRIQGDYRESIRGQIERSLQFLGPARDLSILDEVQTEYVKQTLRDMRLYIEFENKFAPWWPQAGGGGQASGLPATQPASGAR